MKSLFGAAVAAVALVAAGQAAAYGLSDVIRSEGYANLQNSEAAKNWEDAKTKEIDNRQKWTNNVCRTQRIA